MTYVFKAEAASHTFDYCEPRQTNYVIPIVLGGALVTAFGSAFSLVFLLF